MSRYEDRIKAVNDNEMYDKLMEKRGVRRIVQYRTPNAVNIPQEVLDSIESHEYTWASRYYGDPTLWWVIASFNRKPTEGHVKLGEVIYIPKNLADALGVVG